VQLSEVIRLDLNHIPYFITDASVILSLLRIGKVMDGVRAIKHYLLETAPVYRRQPYSPVPSFRGVGRYREQPGSLVTEKPEKKSAPAGGHDHDDY
jgi:hypothetical protein